MVSSMLQIVKRNDNNSMVVALKRLFETDADFMGENGIEYNWEEAKNYDSSCDYLVEKVMNDKSLPTELSRIENFIHEFIKHENNYYDISYDIINRKNEIIVSIALADNN